jgi:hypothetical protein
VAESAKCIKSFRLRCCEHTARMNNEGMSQQIVTARMEGTRERRPWKNVLMRLKRNFIFC